MNETISGKLELERSWGSPGPGEGVELVASHPGGHYAEGNVACVVQGRPIFLDGDLQTLAQAKGSAAALAACWLRFGEALTDRLKGGYAFVLADSGKRVLIAGVDRFSIETLCYLFDGKTFAFSSRADQVPGHANTLNIQAIFDYLYFHAIPAPQTVFADVWRIPAGHTLRLAEGKLTLKRAWQLRFVEDRNLVFPAARDEFRGLIRQSVAREVEGEARVGAFLSGGTDSSTVVGMLCEITGKRAPAYSIGFEAEGYDEMEYARIAARHFNCEHHEYYVTPADLLARIPAVARHFDQPFGNSSALPAYYCAKMAKEDGCSRMLAGDGGDELFGGNARYATQKIFSYYDSMPFAVRSMIEPMCCDGSILRRIPGFRQATGYVRHARIPMPDRMQTFNLIMRLGPGEVLTDALLEQIDLNAPIEHMRDTWNACQDPSLVNRMLAYDWRYTLADSDLPKVRGATSMAGIPVAYPMLDDALTDFSMRLPENWKLRRFKLRWFFKEALRGFLPDEIITKRKQGFGLPFGVWMVDNPGLLDLARASLESLAGRKVVRAEFVSRLFKEYLPQHPGYYGEMVWLLMMMEQWLQGQPGIRVQ